MEIPIKERNEMLVDIVDLGEGGQGVGRANNCTIFVEGVVPGDKIVCRITKVKKNYALGKMLDLAEPSPLRQDPDCQYFGRCGGCQMQAIRYEEQLKIKENWLKNSLERIGGFEDVSVEPIIGMENPWRYRNKGIYPVQMQEEKLKIGFYRQGSHEVVDIDDCLIQDKGTAKIVAAFKKYLQDFKVNIYDPKYHKGVVRHLLIRKAEANDQLMVVVVTNGRKLPMTKILTQKLLEADSRIVSAIQNINSKRTSKVLGEEEKLLYGQEKLVDQIGDLKFEISPYSFYQVNPLQTEVLYNEVLEYAALTGKETVLDLFSGVGTIALSLANQAKQVIGIESVTEAVVDAEKNTMLNQIENVEFMAGKAEELLPELKAKDITADVIVVDPPRTGCEPKLLETMLEMAPERIVYVSCKPSTLARDLKILCADGKYEVKKVQPVDMFPQASHVETVVLMSRVK